MFYGIFMALYYVFTSVLILIFNVCWETPCGETFDFVETIQLIRRANHVNGFCIVWVFTVMNNRADYRFCRFNINKLSRYVIFRKGSLRNRLIVSLLRCRLVLIIGRGEIGCFINRITSNFFFCSYDARISLNNLLPVLSFLLIVLFCVFLQKCSLTRITFCAKLRFGRYFNIRSSMVKFFNFAKRIH